MWDTTIPMIELAMRRDDLEGLPEFALPEAYGWRYFQPGDVDHWVRIERSFYDFANGRDDEFLAGGAYGTAPGLAAEGGVS